VRTTTFPTVGASDISTSRPLQRQWRWPLLRLRRSPSIWGSHHDQTSLVLNGSFVSISLSLFHGGSTPVFQFFPMVHRVCSSRLFAEGVRMRRLQPACHFRSDFGAIRPFTVSVIIARKSESDPIETYACGPRPRP
jgi:hypothetical protein